MRTVDEIMRDIRREAASKLILLPTPEALLLVEEIKRLRDDLEEAGDMMAGEDLLSHGYQIAAVRVLDWLHHAERELMGATVATFNGEAGTVKALRLDDHHGICFTIDDEVSSFDVVERGGSRRFYPVSTIRQRG